MGKIMGANAGGGASRALPLKHHPFKTTFPSEATLLGLEKTSQFYLNHLMLSSFPNFFLNASGVFCFLTMQSKNLHKCYPTDSSSWLPVKEEMADKTPFYR